MHRSKSTSLDVLEHYWWQCKKGHEWQANIASVMWGNDCPKCRTRPATASNNLKTCHQDIAKEWHPLKSASFSFEYLTESPIEGVVVMRT